MSSIVHFSTVQPCSMEDLHSVHLPFCSQNKNQYHRWLKGTHSAAGRKARTHPGLHKVLKGWVSLHPPLAWGDTVLEQKNAAELLCHYITTTKNQSFMCEGSRHTHTQQMCAFKYIKTMCAECTSVAATHTHIDMDCAALPCRLIDVDLPNKDSTSLLSN